MTADGGGAPRRRPSAPARRRRPARRHPRHGVATTWSSAAWRCRATSTVRSGPRCAPTSSSPRASPFAGRRRRIRLHAHDARGRFPDHRPARHGTRGRAARDPPDALFPTDTAGGRQADAEPARAGRVSRRPLRLPRPRPPARWRRRSCRRSPARSSTSIAAAPAWSPASTPRRCRCRRGRVPTASRSRRPRRPGRRRRRGCASGCIEREVMQELLTTGGLCDPAWSPDGKTFAAAGLRGVFTFTEPNFEARVLVAGQLQAAAPGAPAAREYDDPVWSPGGGRIAFRSSAAGAATRRGGRREERRSAAEARRAGQGPAMGRRQDAARRRHARPVP